MRRGLVLPAHGAARFISWDEGGQLLSLLRREIHAESVDSVSLRNAKGSMTVWVDDEGLLKSTPSYNLRAMQLAEACGYPGAVLAGTAVVTGGATAGGDTLGLSDELIDLFGRLAVDTVETAGGVL